MEGLLVARGRFIAKKKKELNLGFFERPKYPFSDDGRYFEVDSVLKEYNFSWGQQDNYVKENASKYCGCLGVSSSELIELIENGEIYFQIMEEYMVDKWVIVYYNEHSERCAECLEILKDGGPINPDWIWSKFKYLYCTHGGNSDTFKKFKPIETMRYSVWQGRGVSIPGTSLLDKMMDKAVKHVADTLLRR